MPGPASGAQAGFSTPFVVSLVALLARFRPQIRHWSPIVNDPRILSPLMSTFPCRPVYSALWPEGKAGAVPAAHCSLLASGKGEDLPRAQLAHCMQTGHPRGDPGVRTGALKRVHFNFSGSSGSHVTAGNGDMRTKTVTSRFSGRLQLQHRGRVQLPRR